MKNTVSTKITDSPQFLAWLKMQKENPEYNYKLTSYYRAKMIEKNKRIFYSTLILLVIAFNVFFLVSFLLCF
jgi:hypothetical protein